MLMKRNFMTTSQQKKSAMSIEKSDKLQNSDNNKSQIIDCDDGNKKKSEPKLNEVVHSTHSIRFHLLLQEAHGDKSDTTLLWKGTITTPTCRVKHLVFKNSEYILSNWTGDKFPSVLYVTSDDVNGYVSGTLPVLTERVAALELSQIQSTMDESNVRTYELKYVMRDSVTWEISPTTSEVKFRMSVDDETDSIILPLPNPITLNFEVRFEI